MENVLAEHGWVDTDLVSTNGNLALFLVIQHSNLATQEKYLEMAREAAKKGKMQPQSLALLEYRISLEKNKYQLYGSQIVKDTLTASWELAPIIDEKNADKRRAQMRLEPLSIYLKRFNIEYKPKE